MKTAFTPARRRLLEKIRRIVFTNPFSPERSALDAEILGAGSPERPASWREPEGEHEAAARIATIARRELEAIPAEERRAILAAGDETALHLRDSICFLLFHQYYRMMDEVIERGLATDDEAVPKETVAFYAAFEREVGRWFDLREDRVPELERGGFPGPEGYWVVDRDWAARIFAFSFQVRRAYYFIYYRIVGVSPAMTRLREAIWAAVFTRNLEWSWRYLAGRMADFSTLISGPTGSGKEQVAQAICRSQYIPFDPRARRFEGDGRALFLPVNLAALSPTLIESELFGHVKGAFTGAVEARDGLMAACSPHGAVFLDEIGELDPETQVKLLRVLQSRLFSPVGGRKARRFEGRIVSATNRDVRELVREGRMREDFYYRLSACSVATPSLRLRFEEDPEEIDVLTRFLARRVLGGKTPLEDMIVEAVADATKAGRAWRGNVRELEQFVRRMLVSLHEAEPEESPAVHAPDWLGRAARADLTLDALLGHYCREARERHGSWEKAAKALEADWRTVKKWAEG